MEDDCPRCARSLHWFCLFSQHLCDSLCIIISSSISSSSNSSSRRLTDKSDLPINYGRFQVCIIGIFGHRLWLITLHSMRRLRGRLTTCYASAARSQGKVLANIKLILEKTINLNYTWLMILLVYLACPALHIVDAVPVNLSSNHSLLCQTGDDLLTSAFAKRKPCRCTNIPNNKHQCLSLKSIHKYIFLNLHI